MMYQLFKPLFFALDAELAHEIALDVLSVIAPVLSTPPSRSPTTIMGLEFKNPVGLAAGMDKNADYIDALAKLGFGFIEVGTVTPQAQLGNPKPRLFRLAKHESIINRMGFNNKGIDHLIRKVKQKHSDIPVGINIGKNLNTPVNKAIDDYLIGLIQSYEVADYITLNISSPNTPGLRSLQSEDALENLLKQVQITAQKLQHKYAKKTPLALKIAPDLMPESIQPISDLLVKYQIDALIANNTTLDRRLVKGHTYEQQAGGLSGLALKYKSRDILVQFQRCLQGEIPIISVGGIDSAEEAKKRMELGAELIQVYSGLIYKGPNLVKQILNSMEQ